MDVGSPIPFREVEWVSYTPYVKWYGYGQFAEHQLADFLHASLRSAS